MTLNHIVSTRKLTKANNNERRPVSASTVLIYVLTVVVIFVCAAIANRLWHQDITVTYENGIIENTQLFFLGLAMILHALQTKRQPRNSTTPRLCHMVLGMLCLSIMVREIDIDKLGPQPGWEIAENTIRLAGGCAWLWLLRGVYRNRWSLWRCKGDIIFTSTSLLTGLGVLMYMASWFFDKSVVPLPLERSQLWEETLQMSGTILLSSAALRPIQAEPC